MALSGAFLALEAKKKKQKGNMIYKKPLMKLIKLNLEN